MIRIALASFAIFGGLLACATPTRPGANDSQARAVLAASKAATGGAAWDAMTGVAEEGEHSGVAYQTRLDFHAYGMRVDSSQEGAPATVGYNGDVAWRSIGGRTMATTDAAIVAERRQSAYISMNGYYFPERFPARFTFLGGEREGHRVYDVIRAEPEGARGIDLWFDAQTHFLARMVDYSGAPPVTVTVSDYRDIGGVQFAFTGVITDASGKVVDTMQVKSMKPTTISRAVFDPPPS